VVLQESGPQIGPLAVLGGDDQDVVHVVAGGTQESGCTRSTCVVHVAAVVCKMSGKDRGTVSENDSKTQITRRSC